MMLSPAIWRAVTNQIEMDVATAVAASLLKLCHREGNDERIKEHEVEVVRTFDPY